MASMATQERAFDLNIQRILEHWTISDAVREIIANALDEQILSGTADISITQDSAGMWHIRDYGRGIMYQHLTQKENAEKLRNGKLIGKFGVGLKDALATFHRRHVAVAIRSRYGDMTLVELNKHGFSDVKTLHVAIYPPSDPEMKGSEFVLSGCSAEDIQKAKGLFLRFSGEQILEETTYGQVLQRLGSAATIYINGVRVAQEENFLFSYNITSLTAGMRRALNRERTNVGREAYSERVKAILLACQSTVVADAIAQDLEKQQSGRQHDELSWVDVAIHGCRLLNATGKVVFVTTEQTVSSPHVIDQIRSEGLRLIVIPETIHERIVGKVDVNGNSVRDLGEYVSFYNSSFKFRFVDRDGLRPYEVDIFDRTSDILSLVCCSARKSSLRSRYSV